MSQSTSNSLTNSPHDTVTHACRVVVVQIIMKMATSRPLDDHDPPARCPPFEKKSEKHFFWLEMAYVLAERYRRHARYAALSSFAFFPLLHAPEKARTRVERRLHSPPELLSPAQRPAQSSATFVPGMLTCFCALGIRCHERSRRHQVPQSPAVPIIY